MGSWPRVEGDELLSFLHMLMKFNSLSDYAVSLESITPVVFLFCLIKNCKSAPSEKMDEICIFFYLRIMMICW